MAGSLSAVLYVEFFENIFNVKPDCAFLNVKGLALANFFERKFIFGKLR
jgi:hypothetical protein